MSLIALLVCVGLLGVPSIHAGCYRNGRTKPQRTWEDEHFNHEAVPQLDRRDLPKSFNWYVFLLWLASCHVVRTKY